MTENQIEALFRIKDSAELFVWEMKDFARQLSPFDDDYSEVECSKELLRKLRELNDAVYFTGEELESLESEVEESA